MSAPDLQTLYAVVEATWPAASTSRLGPWTIRDGKGGGKRASAATAEAPFTPNDIAAAEEAMRALDQTPLFMIRQGETTLDEALEARGYSIIDPVALYACDIAHLRRENAPPVSGFAIWEPLAIMEELWREGGIGDARMAVMERVKGAKTGILARTKDRAAGTAFVAIHQNIAMIHALEVAHGLRRAGTASNIMRIAAKWAQDQGARQMALAVTDANAPANALYLSLGMSVVGSYHYRIAPK
ncbi:MAG: GNAT superfamily N-acetyltransferase [Halocynthiibacter sp.]|jgi:GNAT superfamily N-acetyltransferase